MSVGQPINSGIFENIHFNSFNFQEKVSQLKDITEKVGNFAHQHILKPCAIGVGVGLIKFPAMITFQAILGAFTGVAKAGHDPIKAAEYTKFILENFWKIAVIGPVIEEIIFRVVIQGCFDFLATKIFQDKEVEIFSYKIKLATLVSVVATSILFGLAHYSNGLGIAQVIGTTISGVILGVLRDQYNPLASMAAHITNNTLAAIALTLISKAAK